MNKKNIIYLGIGALVVYLIFRQKGAKADSNSSSFDGINPDFIKGNPFRQSPIERRKRMQLVKSLQK